ncbi:MAG: arsenite methyltransferase [Thermoanaerobaculia bacterium]
MSLPTTDTAENLVSAVRERYGRLASQPGAGCGCGCNSSEAARDLGYSSESLAEVPAGSAELSLGCGAPIGFLDLQPGETVLDLGSGGGLDAFMAARDVGPTGRVLGVDMTPEMLERARAAAAAGGYANVEFREGRLEALPVDDASVDAVTSNCVINLVPDKAAAFREVARVLRPGGRMVVSDLVLSRPLPESLAADLSAYVGCVGGAVLLDRYLGDLRAAGLGEVEVLRDIDYLETIAVTASADVETLLAGAGVTLAEIRGTVRSVTLRAWRTAA